MSELRFCEGCGAPLPPGAKFCENCGRPVSGRASEGAGRQSRPDSRTPVWSSINQDINDRDNIGTDPEENADAGRRTGRSASYPGSNSRYGAGPESYPGSESRRGAGPEAYPGSNSRYGTRSASYPGEGGRRAVRTEDTQRTASDERPNRYRQEELGGSWQQAWDRQIPEEVEAKGFTPVQYVLLGVVVVLLLALTAFGVFWFAGRTSGQQGAGSASGQSAGVSSGHLSGGDDGKNITILNEQDKKETEAQTKPAAETEAQTEQKQTEAQTKQEQPITLEYSEYKVTLPGSWKGKYGVSQSADRCTFYHQASREQGFGGILFEISRYTDQSYTLLAGAQVLGTGGKAAYVFTVPTDVQYGGAAAEEYQKMTKELEWIKSNIQMLVSGEGPAETESPAVQTEQTASSAGISGLGYQPESSDRLLTDADVAGMSSDDLQMAINEIYARHGRKFNSEQIQSYFDSQPWYNGTVAPADFSESVFSQTEAQNIQFLLKKMENQ